MRSTPDEQYEASPLPAAPRPGGVRFYLGTWTGRLLVVNFIVFLFLAWRAGSIFMPDTEALLALGAKDPVALAQGEYWRLITPVFIHIGVIHFAVNSFMLFAIGYQLERIVGGLWFLALYLLSGFAGNVASAVFSTNLSAGASSALFGLLGCGYVLERVVGNRIEETTGQKPRNRAYAMTVAINLAFGFLIPFIDNAAHLGGLVMGVLLTFAMVNLRRNSLQSRRWAPGALALVMAAVLSGVGVYYGTSAEKVRLRLLKAGDEADAPAQSIYHYSQAIAINEDDTLAHLKRARLLLLEGETRYGLQDLRFALTDPSHFDEVELLAAELDGKGQKMSAWEVRRMLSHRMD